MSNTKLDFVKTYIINAIFFVLAYSFQFYWNCIVGICSKEREKPDKTICFMRNPSFFSRTSYSILLLKYV